MSEIMTMNIERIGSAGDRVASSKVAPILESSYSREEVGEEKEEQVIDVGEDEDKDEHEHVDEQDGWLPITESRKGSSLRAACHLLCSGIGIQALLLPISFISLGWFWSIFCLCLAFSWQLYTKWLLVALHESSGGGDGRRIIRYSRFVHLSIRAFGEILGKLLSIFPTMYLSGGTCVLYIISGGTTLELLSMSMSNNETKLITTAEWFLVFACLAIFIALFFHNLNSLASISFVGSITALAYCSLLWALSITKGRVTAEAQPQNHGQPTADAGFRDVLNGIGVIVLAFRGHNLVLEIQGTLPSDSKQPSRRPMWRGVTIAYLAIATCLYPLAIVGYWAYGNRISANGSGVLGAFTRFHRNSTSKHIIAAVYLLIIVNCLCAFQIYAMPTFDNLERLYTSKKKKPCPRWLSSMIKVFFGGLTYFIAVAFPFLPSLGPLIGSIALPLTLVYPCLMWVAIKKPRRFSRMWCLNLGLGSLGIVLSVMCGAAALWSLAVNGLKANFFKPG